MEGIRDAHRFFSWPKGGKLDFPSFLTTIAIIATAAVDLGNLPLYFAGKNAGVNMNYPSMEVLEQALGRNYLFTLILVPFVITILFVFFAIKYVHCSSVKDFFTARKAFDWSRFLFGLIVTASIMTLGFAIDSYANDEVIWNYKADQFWMLLLIAVVLVPIQTTCEELIFRSYLFKAFSWLKFPLITILFCSTAFGLIHMGNPEVDALGKQVLIFYIWSGLFLGVIAYLDGGLELSMAFHAINNIVAAVLITNDWQAFQTDALFINMAEPQMGLDVWLTMFLWQPIIILIFKWKIKWNFKDLFWKSADTKEI